MERRHDLMLERASSHVSSSYDIPFQTQNLNPVDQQAIIMQNRLLARYGLESGLERNPSFIDPAGLQNHHYHQSLEAALSRMNISSTAVNHHSHRFLNDNYRMGSSQLQLLDRMRSISASLGLQTACLNSASDRYNLNGGDNLAALNPYNDTHIFRRRTPSLNYGYSPRSSSTLLDSGTRQFIRSPSRLEVNSAFHAPLRLVQPVNYGKYSSLEQVKGEIATIARDQDGCRFLQNKLDELIPEQTEMIFFELKDQLTDLIVDQFANYVIQKLFMVCSEEQTNQLVFSLIQTEEKLKNICIHLHGTRAMQKVIELIKDNPEQKFSLVSALKGITVFLAKSQNGHHVIQQCLKCFEFDFTRYLLEEIAQSCLEIAMDKCGCCVLQKSMDKAKGELQERIITKVTDNAFGLSVDSYGNYVVQYVLQMHIPRAEAAIMEQLRGNYVNLSMDKYGSNVVEKCLRECNENNAATVIQELMCSPSILEVLQHPYGNYVAQSALQAAKGNLYQELVRLINSYNQQLHSHLHGKKVLARTRSGNRNYRLWE